LHAVNRDFLVTHKSEEIVVDILKVEDYHDISEQDTSVELDEMWS